MTAAAAYPEHPAWLPAEFEHEPPREPDPTDPYWTPSDDPTAEHRQTGHVYYDERGLIDRVLLTSGIRWSVLRWLHRSVRMRLAAQVTKRTTPAGTRACTEGRAVWLDEVRARIDSQPWRPCRKRTYRTAAEVIAASVPAGRRPLTQVTQDQLAAAIGRTDRTVRSILAWLCAERLLAPILTGTRMPPMLLPEDATQAERAALLAEQERHQAQGRAQRRAALAQVKAQTQAFAEGGPVPPVVDLLPYAEFRRQQQRQAKGLPAEQPLMNLASVYELRVPDEREVPVPLPGRPEPEPVPELVAARHRRARHPGPASDCPSCTPPLTSDDGENFRPDAPQGLFLVSPEDKGPVDEERRAPRGSDQEGISWIGKPKSKVRRLSMAQRTAHALLQGPLNGWGEQEDTTLPDPLRRGVSRTWLAAHLRPLVAHGWTTLEIAWHLITQGGAYPHLPARIDNPRGWIRASLRRADPLVKPSAKWGATLLAEDHADQAAQRARRVIDQAAQRDRDRDDLAHRRALARRAEIDACPSCDEYGWVPLDGTGPDVKCDHKPPATDR